MSNVVLFATTLPHQNRKEIKRVLIFACSYHVLLELAENLPRVDLQTWPVYIKEANLLILDYSFAFFFGVCVAEEL